MFFCIYISVNLNSRNIDLQFDWNLNQFKSNHSLANLKKFIEKQKKTSLQIITSPVVSNLFLNKDQQRVIKLVEDFISQPYSYRKDHPLHILVISKAGHGKTAVLNAYADLLETQRIGYQTTGFTGGSCSQLANSKTLHTLFGIPFKCQSLENLMVLIIEELYLITPSLLSFVSSRLEYIFKNDKPFGGLSLIAGGVLGHLFLIGGSLVKNPEPDKPFQSRGIELYRLLTSVIRLDKNIQQKDDDGLQILLENLKVSLKQISNY